MGAFRRIGCYVSGDGFGTKVKLFKLDSNTMIQLNIKGFIMKKFLGVFGIFVLFFIISGCGSNDNTPTKEDNTWTFSIRGSDGIAEDNGDGSFKVTYYNVEDEPTVLKGNIEKDLGVKDMSSLMDNWENVMRNNNNGGMLHHALPDGTSESVHVRITNPVYNKNENTFEFTATPVNTGDTIASSFTDASLEISWWDWGELVLACGMDIASIALAAVEAGGNPIADAMAVGATAACIAEIKDIWDD